MSFVTLTWKPWETSGGDSTNFWYSLDIGGVHIVSSSSEHDYSSLDSPQMEWLAADLEKAVANRDKVPWIIVAIHKVRPFECEFRDLLALSLTHRLSRNISANVLLGHGFQSPFDVTGTNGV